MTEVRRPYHHGNLRQELLDHGLTLLEDQGMASLSLRELAKGLGVSAAAVYRHFADKDALLAEIALLGFRQLGAVFSAVLSESGVPRERLRTLGLAYVDFGMAHPHLYRLMFCSKAGASEEGGGEGNEEGMAPYLLLQGTVAACCGADAAPEKVAAATIAAWAMVHGFVLLRQEGVLSALPPEAWPDTAAVLETLVPGA
ncbi:MAG TPA: TetR/AcrR family transcriptional regulator [Candidatus Sulfotelmatobacter sp.]|jgi:AcrR family transcriptional regulator|nr:TetR/AcrR family transcriptional regulator [Candidatus Sulfotelmatobacter sp.]